MTERDQPCHPPGCMDPIAADIALWQGAADKLPLSEVADLATDCFDELIEALEKFTKAYLPAHGTPASGDQVDHAAVEVLKTATAAAIFTVGIAQRRQRAAAFN